LFTFENYLPPCTLAGFDLTTQAKTIPLDHAIRAVDRFKNPASGSFWDQQVNCLFSSRQVFPGEPVYAQVNRDKKKNSRNQHLEGHEPVYHGHVHQVPVLTISRFGPKNFVHTESYLARRTKFFALNPPKAIV
jgi:hypothetical protein